jgi:hypothetical protein
MMRLSSFHNDRGFGFLLASQNRSRNFPRISGSALTNIGLPEPPLSSFEDNRAKGVKAH